MLTRSTLKANDRERSRARVAYFNIRCRSILLSSDRRLSSLRSSSRLRARTRSIRLQLGFSGCFEHIGEPPRVASSHRAALYVGLAPPRHSSSWHSWETKVRPIHARRSGSASNARRQDRSQRRWGSRKAPTGETSRSRGDDRGGGEAAFRGTGATRGARTDQSDALRE